MQFQQKENGSIIHVSISEIKYSMNGPKNITGLLNIENGQVIYDESPPGDTHIEIPKYVGQYDDMVRFVDMLPDGKEKNSLNAVISGEGAFRNFRKLTRNNTEWYDYRRDIQYKKSLEFLSEIGFGKVD